MRRVLFGLGSIASLLLGCATAPPPLPGARPEQLPEAWLLPMREAPCPHSIEARVRLRIDPPEGSAVQLDGELRAVLPDTLRLSGKVGVFRPVFQFIAVEGFAELLLHDAQSYWIVPSEPADWEAMDPAAWRQAILWSLCPSSIFRSFHPDGPGSMTGRTWTVTGRLLETPFRLEVQVEPGSRSVRTIRLSEGDTEVLHAELADYRFMDAVWMPHRAALRLRQPDGPTEVRIELVGASPLPPGALAATGLVQPPGWRAAGHLGLTLPPDLIRPDGEAPER